MKNLLLAVVVSIGLAACAANIPNPIDASTRSSLKYENYSFNWAITPEQSNASSAREVMRDFEKRLQENLPNKLRPIYRGNKPVEVKITATSLYLPGLGMNWLTGASPTIHTKVAIIDKQNGETLGEYPIIAMWVNTHGLLTGIVQRSMSRGNALGNIFINDLATSLDRK